MPFELGPFDWTVPSVIAVLVGWVILLTGFILSSRSKDWIWVVLLGIAGLFMAMTVISISAATVAESHYHNEKVAALEDFKYDNVQLEDDEFTASKNGRYVEGQLIRDGDKWRIVILEGAE